jgi:hypothetical protein
VLAWEAKTDAFQADEYAAAMWRNPRPEKQKLATLPIAPPVGRLPLLAGSSAFAEAMSPAGSDRGRSADGAAVIPSSPCTVMGRLGLSEAFRLT